jgi:hypothetical protein
MNKTSILFLFGFLALASATFLEKTESPKTAAAFDTSSLSPVELYLVAIGFLAVGALNLLFGLKYFKVIVFLIGFVGAATATYAIEYATNNNHLTVILYSLIAGVIGGVIFYFCYHCSIFTLGFVLFGGIAAGLLIKVGADGAIAGLIFLVAGIVGGIVALKVHDIIIILATSFSGAGYITTSVCIFINGVRFGLYYGDNMYILMLIALAVGGIIFQFKNKDVNVKDIGRDSVSSPDVYNLNVNVGDTYNTGNSYNTGNTYNPYTGSRF